MVTLIPPDRKHIDAPSMQEDCPFTRPGKALFVGQAKTIKLLLRAVVLLCVVNETIAQTAALENQVKAAFLYKFPAYVEWPSSSFADETSPMVFGILEADAMADELSLISQDSLLNGRAIVIKKLQPGDSTEGLNVLFIGESRTSRSEPVLLEALSSSVLTVTEAPAQRPGSIINFAIIDDRVRFDVSLAMAEQAGLTISSRLLQVARRVIEQNP